MLNRTLTANKLRDAWVEINLGNLEYNINSIKEKIKENLPKDAEMPKFLAVRRLWSWKHYVRPNPCSMRR